MYNTYWIVATWRRDRGITWHVRWGLPILVTSLLSLWPLRFVKVKIKYFWFVMWPHNQSVTWLVGWFPSSWVSTLPNYLHLVLLRTLSFIQIFNSSYELLKRWNLSGLAFILLFENHSFKSLDASSKHSMAFLVFIPMTCNVYYHQHTLQILCFLKLKIIHI